MTHAVRASTRALIALTLVMTAGLTGCPFMPDKDKDPVDPIPDFRPRTSPENLLYNLKQAYKLRNVAEYESLLALREPAFTFVLSQDDQQDPGMPDQWGRQVEIDIHRNMFDADIVQTLTLDFVPLGQEWDPTDNMWSIMINNVNLRLYGTIPGQEGEGAKELKVEASTSKFWFREEPWTAPGTSDNIWTIVKWEDNPQGALARLKAQQL